MISSLNWREWELFIQKIKPEIEGLFVERVIIPEREAFPQGYLKGEWSLRLTGRRQEGVLTLSVRPRHPYLTWRSGKGPKASQKATRSAFDLSLSKHLKGARLLSCETLPKERIGVLWFSEEGKEKSRLGLVLVFIPAVPEALLVSASRSPDTHWHILARSRNTEQKGGIYTPPSGAQAPPNPPLRSELLNPPAEYLQAIEKDLSQEAFETRLNLIQKSLKHLLKQAQDRFRQSETALKESEQEPQWQKRGDLLKASLATPPPLIHSAREVIDYETGEKISILCDPKLTIQQQVEKFYQNARRKQKRAEEARSRMNRFEESICRFQRLLENLPQPFNWIELDKVEKTVGISPSTVLENPSNKTQGKSNDRPGSWLGKIFTSREGLAIWVGRSKDENLELTFKQTRGNDLWMHIRGRPGAHVVIPLQPGKSASLETLLDAAHLAIYYSGGEKWGKTEVDYTLKKYVKRIKDSTEASYTHNKTLLVEPDPHRIKRLLDQSA